MYQNRCDSIAPISINAMSSIHPINLMNLTENMILLGIANEHEKKESIYVIFQRLSAIGRRTGASTIPCVRNGYFVMKFNFENILCWSTTKWKIVWLERAGCDTIVISIVASGVHIDWFPILLSVLRTEFPLR